VADSLDVVAVRIEHISAVIVGVVHGANPWGAIVDSAGVECRRVEGIDLAAGVSGQGDVQPPPYRSAVRLDPETQGFPAVPSPAAWPAGSMINVSPKGVAKHPRSSRNPARAVAEDGDGRAPGGLLVNEVNEPAQQIRVGLWQHPMT